MTVSVGVTLMVRMSYHRSPRTTCGPAGRYIATHGAPSIDAFTFSMLGRPWLDRRSYQVLLALVYRASRWAAMGFFHGALVGATLSFWLEPFKPAGHQHD